MATSAPHTRGVGSETRRCGCGNKISNKDPHQVCSSCLGLQHARQAIELPGSCPQCAVFTTKSLRRRFARLANLSGADPFLPAVDRQVDSGEEKGVEAEMAPEPVVSWGSQLDLVSAPQEEDVLHLDYGDDEDDVLSELLISEDDDGDDIFAAPVGAAKPRAGAASRESEGSSTPVSPLPGSDLLDVCKRAAERLAVPWPAVVEEAARSRYEGKKLPLARSAAKQLLPVFPELLEEVKRSWNDRPYSGRSSIPGSSSLDCEAMEGLGLLRMPPIETPVAAHLQGRQASMSSRGAVLPSKSDRLQSALSEKAYRAAALSARALNVLSMLTAYQAELCEDLAQTQDPATLEEVAVISDLCLRIQRCAVQATGKAMGSMVLQERARWLNLASLSDREKNDILDMPIVPEGVFGSALASMQRRCEAKKKEDEALQLCLPRKAPSSPPPVQRRAFVQAASRGPRFKTPQQHGPRPVPPPVPRQESKQGWRGKPPAQTAAPPPQPAQAGGFHGKRKKRAA